MTRRSRQATSGRRTLFVGAVLTVLTAPGCRPDCDELERSAERLLHDHQTCESDGDCMGIDLEVRCLPAFVCPVAVSRSEGIEALRMRAADLARDYERSCDTCAVASCAVDVNSAVFCDAVTSRCAFAPTP